MKQEKSKTERILKGLIVFLFAMLLGQCMAYGQNTYEGKVSSTNSSSALLGANDTLTGKAEICTDYSSVTVFVYSDVASATNGLSLEFSTDGVNWDSKKTYTIEAATSQTPSTPILAKYFRVVYYNGATPQGAFRIQTILHKKQQGELTASLTAIDPSGNNVDIKGSGIAFTTQSVLTSGQTYTSSVISLIGYTQVQTHVDASHNGTMVFDFCSDGSCATIVRSLTVPYVASNGFQLFSAPAFSDYVRYKFTNTASVTQTNFLYETKVLNTALSPQVLIVKAPVASGMTTTLTRVVNTPNLDRNIGLKLGEEQKRVFGVNTAVSGTEEDVWTVGGLSTRIQTAETIRIKAGGNAADTSNGAGARRIVVTYLNANYVKTIDTLTTKGALASDATSSTAIRLLEAYVYESGTYGSANTGKITFETTSTNDVMGEIAAGVGATEMAIFTVDSGKTVYITKMTISVGQGNSADVSLYHIDDTDDISAPFTSALHKEFSIQDFSGAQEFSFDTYLKFTEKNDIIVRAKKVTGGGDATVSVQVHYILVDN